ncbi:MAG: type II toxin-antitoxin system HigB family toxin [Reichenbachiella sp.]|uniref:type II toxin-antitoxin system HigB family toxin n=1 Tax=Reichenbachiella sp. TaxID=2184521 RepID=UPI00326674C2
MRVVSRKKLVDYYSKHSTSKVALEDWYKKVNKAKWINLNQLKNDFLSADYVGNNRVIFNIKGNDFRLVAIIIYVSQKVYVRWIGTHAEYDKINAKEV